MNRYTTTKTLTQSLIISHVLTSFVPLGFIVVFTLAFIIQGVEEDFLVKINMLSQGAKGQIQLFMAQPLSVMRNMAAMLSHDNVGSKDVDTVLHAHLRDSIYFDAIYLLDGSGTVVNAALPQERSEYLEEFLGINLGHKKEFQRVRATAQAQWSDTFLSLSSGKISLTLYTPAENDHVLAADINLHNLAQLITRLSSDKVITAVIDRNGAIIIHPDPLLMGSSIMMNNIPLVTEALEGREQTAEFSFQGERYLGATSIIEPTGWVCLFAEPIRHLSRRLLIPLIIFGAGLLGAIVLSLLLALYKARGLAQPIMEMIEQSGVIAQGDYGRSLPKSDIKELGQLTDSINAMADSIKKREEQLRENELKYRDFVENTSNLILRLEQDLTISYVNNTIESLVGISPEQAVGKPLEEFVDQQGWLHFQDCYTTWLVEQRHSGATEIRVCHRDGTLRNLLLTAYLHYNERKELTDINIIGHDITARMEFEQQQRQLERQRQQSQKMELLGLMAGGVAHDLNNILAGIVNYPELLLLKLEADSPLRPTIESIKKSGERAVAVVADLLTIARESAVVHKICSLNELVTNYCLTPEFNRLRQHHPTVQFQFTAEEQLYDISCSPIHIEKSIMNLVTNAFEAVGNSGKVELVTENIEADAASSLVPDLPQGRLVRLRVRDNGEGISEENQQHIFEPFFSKKRLGRSGTGLGLTVTWNTVREHGGTITVTSSAAGTEFAVYLPATEAALAQPAAEEASVEPHGENERILVVDDEEQLCEIAVHMLELLNYQPVAVGSGEEALAYVAEHDVDLILLDMLMEPGMNGKQTYEQICRIRPGQKAIIATGFSTSEDVQATLRLGAGAFITKPYSMNELAMAIRKELQRPVA